MLLQAKEILVELMGQERTCFSKAAVRLDMQKSELNVSKLQNYAGSRQQ